MTSGIRGSALLIVAVSVAGCATRPSAPTHQAKNTADEPDGPVIVHLVGRHETITVTSSPRGPLYSARGSDGQTIVANATLDELRAEHPEIYRLLEPGVAADASADVSARR